MESSVTPGNGPQTPQDSLNGKAPNAVPPTDNAVVEDADEQPALWAKQNLANLVVGIAIFAMVLWFFRPLDVLLAAVGLTTIIFIHEFGHFAAAKLCRVRVDTFSIGFGPAIPGCHFKYGETHYKLAVVPLGGFVKMLGQEDGVIDAEPDNDPRSYKNQTVPERMLIISAGVIMNVLLGGFLFLIVYLHGLEEKPGEVAFIEPGGAAWRQGVHSGSTIEKLGSREKPWFDDIRPTVWATHEGEKLPVTLSFQGKTQELQIEPMLEEGAPYPVLGISPPEDLRLPRSLNNDPPPYQPGSPASQAKAADGKGFVSGDRIVAMTDPTSGGKVTDLPPTSGIYEYYRRLRLLAGKPITFEVVRDKDSSSTRVSVEVPPTFRKESGLRMRMGQVVALRAGSSAEKAGVQPKSASSSGDRIIGIEFVDDGKVVSYAADLTPEETTNRRVQPLDPLRLPLQLNQWADRTPGTKTVKVTVLREVDHASKRETLTLAWDEISRQDLTNFSSSDNTPVAINGLGLGYQVQAVVDAVAEKSPAAEAGIQPNDTIEEVRIRYKDHTGKERAAPWGPVKPHQWAAVDRYMQDSSVVDVEIRVLRNGQKIEGMKILTKQDTTLPVEERGLHFDLEYRIQKAETIAEALEMGFHRTMRSIKGIYLNLYAMVFGRMSALQTLNGPLRLAQAAYILAGKSTWQLLLLLAMISINLAVVNFLPIPVLDGGHMVFLTYEALRGKPAPEKVQVWLTIAGLMFILPLMVFLLGLDIYRFVTMWIRNW